MPMLNRFAISMFGKKDDMGSWQDWDETNPDVMQSDDTWVVFFDNPVANSHEYGIGGGLSEAESLVTRVGTIAGAVGDPPYRYISGSNSNYFDFQDAQLNLLRNMEFTMLLKVGNVQAGWGLIRFDMSPFNQRSGMPAGTPGVGSIGFLGSNAAAGGPITVYASGARYNKGPAGVTAAYMSGDIWMALWSDGIRVSCGVSKRKPTKRSDFDYSHDYPQIFPIDFVNSVLNGTHKKLSFYLYGLYGELASPANYFYLLMSKKNLIENDL